MTQKRDFSALELLELKDPAIGVKFDYFRPENVPEMDNSVPCSLCEMFRQAQLEHRPFFFSKDHKETCVGKILLGMEQMESFAQSGMIGQKLKVFQEARANRHLYQFVPRIEANTVNYVSFAPVDQMPYDPDVLVISADPKKAEIVMRAATYSTGEPYTSSCTAVMGCAWYLIAPFKTGKINFILPAFVHGPTGRELYPADTVLVSIPYRWIPTVLENLKQMELHLHSHEGKQQYYSEFEGILAELSQKAKNP